MMPIRELVKLAITVLGSASTESNEALEGSLSVIGYTFPCTHHTCPEYTYSIRYYIVALRERERESI